MQNPVTHTVALSFAPASVIAVIGRCRHCGAVVARTFKNGTPGGRYATPHQCPPPPASAMALAA